MYILRWCIIYYNISWFAIRVLLATVLVRPHEPTKSKTTNRTDDAKCSVHKLAN